MYTLIENKHMCFEDAARDMLCLPNILLSYRSEELKLLMTDPSDIISSTVLFLISQSVLAFRDATVEVELADLENESPEECERVRLGSFSLLLRKEAMPFLGGAEETLGACMLPIAKDLLRRSPAGFSSSALAVPTAALGLPPLSLPGPADFISRDLWHLSCCE